MLHIEGKIVLDTVIDIDLTAKGVSSKNEVLKCIEYMPDVITELLRSEMFYDDEGRIKSNIRASWVNKTITHE